MNGFENAFIRMFFLQKNLVEMQQLRMFDWKFGLYANCYVYLSNYEVYRYPWWSKYQEIYFSEKMIRAWGYVALYSPLKALI